MNAVDRLMLVGLLTIAREHTRALEEIAQTMCKVTVDACAISEDYLRGCLSDLIYDGGPAPVPQAIDSLLKSLGVTVEG